MLNALARVAAHPQLPDAFPSQFEVDSSPDLEVTVMSSALTRATAHTDFADWLRALPIQAELALTAAPVLKKIALHPATPDLPSQLISSAFRQTKLNTAVILARTVMLTRVSGHPHLQGALLARFTLLRDSSGGILFPRFRLCVCFVSFVSIPTKY